MNDYPMHYYAWFITPAGEVRLYSAMMREKVNRPGPRFGISAFLTLVLENGLPITDGKKQR